MDGFKSLKLNLASLYRSMGRQIKNRTSLFFEPRVVSSEDAEVLLKEGARQLSVYGRLCPLESSRRHVLTKQCTGTMPVVAGDYIFFLRHEQAVKEFVSKSNQYLYRAPPKMIHVPKLCIVGTPKSGTSTVAHRVALHFDLEYITASRAINYVVEQCAKSELAHKLSALLRQGKDAPSDLVVAAIELLTARAICAHKGWLLDGFPVKKEDVEAMMAHHLMPDKIIEVTVDLEVALKRAQKEFDESANAEHPVVRLNSEPIVRLRDQVYRTALPDLKACFGDQVGCHWVTVNGNQSKWAVEKKMCSIVHEFANKRQFYMDNVAKSLPAPSFDVGRAGGSTPSTFGQYCAVTFVDGNELEVVSHYHFAVEYQGVEYRLRGYQEMLCFLTQPHKYASHQGLPPALPRRRTWEEMHTMVPQGMQFGAYCLVSFYHGPQTMESLVEGSANHVVEYDGKFYCFVNEECRSTFMRCPWKYTAHQAPSKLPPRKSDVNMAELPLVAFMEMNLSGILNQALLAVGRDKPKYPFKPLDKSAAEYLALYLKAHNPALQEHVRQSYATRLGEFRHQCDLLKYLAKTMTKEFREPKQREPGFDDKMNLFLSLKKPSKRQQQGPARG
jgi:adenylate kinase family enzyme/YHS domain-containing protein